jgi:hypothetical protein
MRILLCLLMIAAAGVTRGEQPVVEVFLPPLPSGQLDTALLRAHGVVEKIYSEIGVRVIWRSTSALPSGCSKAPLHRNIVVTLSERVPTGTSNGALAYANPFATKGPCITLLLPRLLPAVSRNPISSVALLGHVLAHEMGHVLQGFARHSDAGVMKHNWSLQDIWHLSRDPLHFLPDDAEIILRSLGAGINSADPAQRAGHTAVRVAPGEHTVPY